MSRDMRDVWVVGAIVVLASCASQPKLSEAQARQVEVGLTAVQRSGVDGAEAARVLYALCAEVPACASGCEDELRACASPATDSAQRAALLASCSSFDYRSRRDRGDALSPEAWVFARIDRVAEEAGPLLPAADAKRLDEARRAVARLGLGDGAARTRQP